MWEQSFICEKFLNWKINFWQNMIIQIMFLPSEHLQYVSFKEFTYFIYLSYLNL